MTENVINNITLFIHSGIKKKASPIIIKPKWQLVRKLKIQEMGIV